MPNVFIVTPQFGYDKMMLDAGWAVVDKKENADVLLFTGGEDVSPSYYGEQKHPHTYASSYRDKVEKEVFDWALENDVPMVGICRGGQFLNVMSGGRMYQHVENHTRSHFLEDVETGEQVMVSSTHHQMMRPAVYGELVAIANEEGGKEWMVGDQINKTFEGPDAEVIWYPQTECLCFQPHPEFSGYKDCRDYFFKLINRYLKF